MLRLYSAQPTQLHTAALRSSLEESFWSRAAEFYPPEIGDLSPSSCTSGVLFIVKQTNLNWSQSPLTSAPNLWQSNALKE